MNSKRTLGELNNEAMTKYILKNFIFHIFTYLEENCYKNSWVNEIILKCHFFLNNKYQENTKS